MKPPDILVAVDAHIARLDAELHAYREFRVRLGQLNGATGAALPSRAGAPARGTLRAAKAAKAKGTSGRRQPLAPGSLPDRIVSILTEHGAPMPLATLVDKAKARKPDVVAAKNELVEAKRIVSVGGGRWTQYAMPQFANVIVADTD